jgi:hypothetical protein
VNHYISYFCLAPPQLPGPEKCANREPREPLYFLLFYPNYPPLAQPSRVSLAGSLFPTHLQRPGPEKCANREPREPATSIPPPYLLASIEGYISHPARIVPSARFRPPQPATAASRLPTAVSCPMTMGLGAAASHVRAALHD